MARGEESAQNQYLEYSEPSLVPDRDNFLVQCHRPRKFVWPYHHHASIEVNFLDGCEMDYSFTGTAVTVKPGRMTVFWGAAPHRVIDVRGSGQVVNVYVSFSQVLRWGLPTPFVDALVGGDIIGADRDSPTDRVMFQRWADEYREGTPAWRKLIIGEVEMRFRRLALEGWSVLMQGHGEARAVVGSSGAAMQHIEEMLRYIADNYASAITVTDVAEHVGLSANYAMTLFRRVIGMPIMEHVTRIRLSHAQMLLTNSDKKILTIAMDSGFGSLSSFYETFTSRTQKTPAAYRRESRL